MEDALDVSLEIDVVVDADMAGQDIAGIDGGPNDSTDANDGETDGPACVPADCEDGNSCTVDTCSGNVCKHQLTANCSLPCLSNQDCPTGVCDSAAMACVTCVADLDCPTGNFCQGNVCNKGLNCTSDSECKGSSQVCDTVAQFCVDCVTSLDCQGGEECWNGT
jgi:Cys-rich repeat protein